MEISGCKGNTEEPVASESVEIVDERKIDDNFINIPIDIYVEAAKNNELTDTVSISVSSFFFAASDRYLCGSCKKQ